MQALDMNDKAALVTGAASGLGRATAIALAKAGANVLILDVNAAGLEETAGEIAALGCKAVVHATNLANPANCAPAVQAAVDAFGRLDALCNVAGVIKFAHTPEMSAEDYALTIAINLNAPFFLSQAAIPHLLEANGAIVNVTSSAAFVGEAYVAAYCASKAGLTHMTKALAMEYSHKPIRINAVAPGGMMTGIVNGMTMPDDVDYELIARFSGLRGLVEVDDVANVIAYLVSPAAEGFHGACINMDRGITAG
ncbi:MAG TPA: SDR family oxidoreductase [Sphingobium sp.]|uniref:SDR family NAD(P)-dependent oxidoreductase n=1 Tax=Sphingobium sp. TaxID=1912891 RepID=UPI002ED2F698